jgi:hypothetical protein
VLPAAGQHSSTPLTTWVPFFDFLFEVQLPLATLVPTHAVRLDWVWIIPPSFVHLATNQWLLCWYACDCDWTGVESPYL